MLLHHAVAPKGTLVLEREVALRLLKVPEP